LISEGISDDDYREWRLDLEDEKRREVELREDAEAADARDAELRANGMDPMPPRRTSEEVAEIERREEERERREKRRGQASWGDDEPAADPDS
jgi:hypothetical protein